MIDREPTLGDMIRHLWQMRLSLVMGGVLGIAFGFLWLWIAVPQYKSSMIVEPAERSSLFALQPAAGIGRGINAQGTQADKRQRPDTSQTDFMRFEHIIKGPAVAKILMKDPKIMIFVAQDKSWRFQKRERIQTEAELSEYLQKNIGIESVAETPMRRIVYLHPDPLFASYMIQRLHVITDNLIRRDIKQRTQSRRLYLQEALHKSTHPDHKRILTSLLMDQEQMQMLLAMNEPFVASIAEPAASTSKPYWPRKTLVLSVMCLIGTMCGYVLASFKET